MTLSHPHPERPYELPGEMLGERPARPEHERWERGGPAGARGDRRRAGAVGHLRPLRRRRAVLERSTRSGVRDGADLVVEGYDFAPTFSIWTTIEECLNPPLIWERERGFYTTAPFSEPEMFEFPEGIGPVECVNVEHEEVVLIPRWVDCERVTFKYGLGQEFIDVLATLHKLGLDSTEPVSRARRRGLAARRRRRGAARPGDARRAHERAHLRGHLGDRHRQGRRSRARPTSTTSSTTRRRCASTAARRSSGRRRSTRSSRSSCSTAATGRAPACSGPEAFAAQPFLELLARVRLAARRSSS